MFNKENFNETCHELKSEQGFENILKRKITDIYVYIRKHMIKVL